MIGTAVVQQTNRIHSAIESDGAARSALIASWRRSSALHHLDPAERKPPRRLTETELRETRQRIEPLTRAAQASLDRLW
jgi:transcriptional regulator of acetoin/glycerol metabolism